MRRHIVRRFILCAYFGGDLWESHGRDTRAQSDAQSEAPKSSVTNIQPTLPLISARAVSLYLSVMEFTIALSLPICILDD